MTKAAVKTALEPGVVLERTELSRSPWEERSRYKVLLDGEHVGFAFFPRGFGGYWYANILEPASYHEHLGEDLTNYGHPDLNKLSHPSKLNTWGSGTTKFDSKEEAANAFKFWREKEPGKVPTWQQSWKDIHEEKARQDQRKVEDAERSRINRLEVEERNRKWEEERVETLEGLKSLRGRQDITNFESMALERAIKKFEK